jgi:hypothetical protein
MYEPMADHQHGVNPAELSDDDLRRELAHLHQTRHDTLLGGSQDALDTHTRRMLALEGEFLTTRDARAGSLLALER